MRDRKSDYPLCRHLKTNGITCQSPAISGSAFCYHHRKLHGVRRRSGTAGPGLSTHLLYPLRHSDSLQQALGMVVSALASNRIQARSAGRMIYALQIACTELNKTL